MDNTTMEPFQEAYIDILYAYDLYIAFGAVAMFANACILLVFFSSNTLRVKYQMLLALALANLINGIGFVCAGAIKRRLFLATTWDNFPDATIWYCARQPYPALQIIGAQWPAIITFMLGMERFAAVHFPIWYKINVTVKFRSVMVVASIIFSLVSLGIGYLQAYFFFRDEEQIFLCAISNAFEKYYTSWNYIVTIFGHSIAFMLNANAFLTARYKSKLVTSSAVSASLRKEIMLVRLMLGLAGFSVLLVSIPNIVLWGESWVWTINSNILGYLDVCFCCSSAINIIIYTSFNKEFRIRLIYLVTCGGCGAYTTTSTPVSVLPGTKSTGAMQVSFMSKVSNISNTASAPRSDVPVALISEEEIM